MTNTKFNWFLLYCKPREEERGLKHLQNQGIEAFYPTINVEKVRKGIRSTTSEALFPNYLFEAFSHGASPWRVSAPAPRPAPRV